MIRRAVCGIVALSLTTFALAVATPPPAASAQTGALPSTVPSGCTPSTTTTIGSCIVDAGPTTAFNAIGTMHTATFTCDRGVVSSGFSGGTGAAAVPPGCYDVTATVGNATTGITAPILYATCGPIPTGPSGGNVDCSRTQSPICPVTTTPTGVPAAPCASRPASAATTANTVSLTINPGAPNVDLITFSGYIPTTVLGSCPAGTILMRGVVLTRSSARPPIGSMFVPPNGACRFSVSAQKKYVEITNVTLTPLTTCGGSLIFVEGLKMAFGPPCVVVATATGTVVLKTGVNCALEPRTGTPAGQDFPPGSYYVCTNGALSVAGIPVPGATLTYIVSGAGSFTVAGTLGYYCAGVPGGFVTQAPSGTPVTICPTGMGLVSVMACSFSTGFSQPTICSNRDPATYR